MCSRYLVSDMLSALCNKRCFYSDSINVPYNFVCAGILSIMKDNGYIKDFTTNTEGKKSIDVLLRLFNGERVFNAFKLCSLPGRRVYMKKSEIVKMLKYNSRSLFIISTSKGILSAVDAVKNGVGGEVLCEVF